MNNQVKTIIDRVESDACMLGFTLSINDLEIVRLIKNEIGADHEVKFEFTDVDFIINFEINVSDFSKFKKLRDIINSSFKKETTVKIKKNCFTDVPMGTLPSFSVNVSRPLNKLTESNIMSQQSNFEAINKATADVIKDAAAAEMALKNITKLEAVAEAAIKNIAKLEAEAKAAKEAADVFTAKIKAESEKAKEKAEDSTSFIETTPGKVLTYGSIALSLAAATFVGLDLYKNNFYRNGPVVVES